MKSFTVPFDFEPPALRRIGLAVERVNGVNLAQGLCLLPVPEPVIEGAHTAMLAGHNRYTLAQGIIELREALASRLQRFNRLACSADSLIITAGSTGAFEIVCEAMLAPGDEVVTFTPFYPYHRNTLKRRGATIKFVELAGDQWTFSAEALDRAITPTTKFILLTNPGNPTGKVFSRAELEQIAEVARKRDVLVVSDEVYEYLTYDGRLPSPVGGSDTCCRLHSCTTRLRSSTTRCSSARQPRFSTVWLTGFRFCQRASTQGSE
jgi:aminotransferase